MGAPWEQRTRARTDGCVLRPCRLRVAVKRRGERTIPARSRRTVAARAGRRPSRRGRAASTRVPAVDLRLVPLQIARRDRPIDRKRGSIRSTTSSAMFITASSPAGALATTRPRRRSRPRSRPYLERHLVDIDGGTGAKPSFAAAMESTPEPQPTSSRLVGSTSCRSSRQSRVVACAPVPNARPGSITTASASVRRLLPRRTDPEAPDPHAVMESAPRVLPALGDVVDRDDVEAERRLVGVDGERAVELLDALREDVEQERELGLAADDDDTASAERALELAEEPFGLP